MRGSLEGALFITSIACFLFFCLSYASRNIILYQEIWNSQISSPLLKLSRRQYYFSHNLKRKNIGPGNWAPEAQREFHPHWLAVTSVRGRKQKQYVRVGYGDINSNSTRSQNQNTSINNFSGGSSGNSANSGSSGRLCVKTQFWQNLLWMWKHIFCSSSTKFFDYSYWFVLLSVIYLINVFLLWKIRILI